MKITEPNPETLAAALAGELAALDALLLAIQSGVFNLAVRMLGQREDAADATQEILLKVTTHLAAFRGHSRFSTWVYSIARRHLLDTLGARGPAMTSLEAIGERLSEGLVFADRAQHAAGERALTPEDKLEARQMALGCTQNMLMALDAEQRLAYVLDLLLGLDSNEAAAVCGVSPAAHRQRLARARARLDPFFKSTCGLARDSALCRCERQLPALRELARTHGPSQGLRAHGAAELEAAERQLESLQRLGTAVEVLRAHPAYQAPQAQIAAIRAVLGAAGVLGSAGPAASH